MAEAENPIDAADVPTARSEASNGDAANALVPESESGNVGEPAPSEKSEVETARPEDILNKRTQLQHPLVSYVKNS